MVPKFAEANIDENLAHSERSALNMEWPKRCGTMLLQIVLSGKAQKTYAALPVEDSADYELVPEAYRHKFRSHRKGKGQSYLAFIKDKDRQFDRGCTSKNFGEAYNKLKQLILMEEFMNCVPDKLKEYLNESDDMKLID